MAKEYNITDLPQRITNRLKIAESGCWEWYGVRNAKGYGRISVYNKLEYVHRVTFRLLVGEIPPGLEMDHLCRNPRCVNPAHLEPVTRKENSLRGIGFAAVNAKKSACHNGHSYTSNNTLRDDSYRKCRECVRLRAVAKRVGKKFSEVLADQNNPEYARQYWRPAPRLG